MEVVRPGGGCELEVEDDGALEAGAACGLDEAAPSCELAVSCWFWPQTAAMAVEQYGVLERLLARGDLADALGLKPEQVQRQARRARSTIALHAFHGYFKARKWDEAGRWLVRALRSDPRALFQRRWIGLGVASIVRRIVE